MQNQQSLAQSICRDPGGPPFIDFFGRAVGSMLLLDTPKVLVVADAPALPDCRQSAGFERAHQWLRIRDDARSRRF
jgi:hypothetical protein